MRHMIDPKTDLAGATPETLARALLRPIGPRPNAPRRKAQRTGRSDNRKGIRRENT